MVALGSVWKYLHSLTLFTLSLATVEYDTIRRAAPECNTNRKREELLRHVSKYIEVRPADTGPPNADIPGAISFYLWLSSLEHVNENDNSFAVIGGLTLSVKNILELKWDKSNYCNISMLSMPTYSRRFWSPIPLSNFLKQRIETSRRQVILWSHGFLEIDMWSYSVITLKCQFNPVWYPVDTQVCTWTLLLFGSMESVIDPDVFCTFYTRDDSHPTWSMLSCDANTTTQDGGYSLVINWRILLHRRYAYAFITIVAPTLVLANTNPVIFVLPAHAPQKTNVGLSFLLAFFIYMATLTNSLPESVNQPYFFYYLLAVLVLNCLAIIFSSILQNRKPEDPQAHRDNRICLVFMLVMELGLATAYLTALLLAPQPKCFEKTCEYLGQTASAHDSCHYNTCMYQGQNITYRKMVLWD